MAKKLLGFFNKQKQFEQDVMENGMQYSSFYGDSLRRLKKNKMAMFCACVLILLALMAIFAPLLAPYDPTYQDYSAVLGGPCKAHPFGTDEFGRDILSRIIYGSRVSISIGIVAQIIASIVGVTLGSLAGYYGGWIDSLISRVMEIFQAFPDLIFAMAIMTFLGPVYRPGPSDLGPHRAYDPRFCHAVKRKRIRRGSPRLRSIYLLDHHEGTGSELPVHHYRPGYPWYPERNHVRGILKLFGHRYPAADSVMGQYDQCGTDLYQLPPGIQHHAWCGYHDHSYRIQYLR